MSTPAGMMAPPAGEQAIACPRSSRSGLSRVCALRLRKGLVWAWLHVCASLPPVGKALPKRGRNAQVFHTLLHDQYSGNVLQRKRQGKGGDARSTSFLSDPAAQIRGLFLFLFLSRARHLHGVLPSSASGLAAALARSRRIVSAGFFSELTRVQQSDVSDSTCSRRKT